MVLVKSFLHSILITSAIVFGSAFLFGFQSAPFISKLLYSPLGFVIVFSTFFLELIGIRW